MPEKYRYLKILHEDRDLLVVEKSAGLHSVALPGRAGGRTLISEVRNYLKRKYRSASGAYVSSLHRLDVETSGVMVVACSRAGEQLRDDFKEHRIRREYLAIVEGRVEEEEGVIDVPIEKGEFGHGRKARVASKGQGKQARTEFRVQERYREATLLEVTMQTGRTHQIRVHLASKGHPLLGDKIYGSGIGLKRHALHATLLGFKHPTSGRKLEFRSPLPRDMEELVDRLRGS